MSEYIVLNENANKKQSKKKYKCPYCQHRDTRVDLVYHINEEHEDLLPEGFSAARTVFNYINKKESGKCIQCGGESPWNEEKWRYERICCKKCNDDYAREFKKVRMMNKYGVEHMLNDPEVQKNMLSNRKISGEYKFKDGGIRSYCGSYERKLLEFYDKVLNVHSNDIETPGPVIEYEFMGKTLKWITDIYYIPANLVHDVKDGGDNPNKRQMDEYRAKQDAKEASIAKLDKYNYIRLTDNNFQQLLLILSELKEQLVNNVDEFIIRINESSITAGTIPTSTDSDVYIVPYMMNNSLIGTAITDSKDMSNLYIIKDGKKEKTNPTFLKDYDYTLLKYNDKVNLESMIDEDEEYNQFYFYEKLTNKNIIDSKQIFLDNDFEEVLDIYSECEIKKSILESSLLNSINEINSNNILFSLTSIEDINKKNSITLESGYHNVDILQSQEGYIVYNNYNYKSSTIYESIDSIPKSLIKVLNTL